MGTQGHRPNLPERPCDAAVLRGWGWDSHRRDSSDKGGGGGGDSPGGDDSDPTNDDGGLTADAECFGALDHSLARTSTLYGSLSLLVRNCWAQGPEDRPDFTEVVRFLEQLTAPTGPSHPTTGATTAGTAATAVTAAPAA